MTPLEGGPLEPDFYARSAEEVARDLLGAFLVSSIGGERVTGRIVETEAYIGPEDPASHAAERIGRTARNESMFGAPGIAYVYRIYGIHWCLNAVTGEPGHPAAVLIRAIEPVHGLDIMRRRRRDPGRTRHPRGEDWPPDRELARGPAKLAQALAIDGSLDRHRLQEPPLSIHTGSGFSGDAIAAGPRIGVTRAADWELRFYLRNSRWVS